MKIFISSTLVRIGFSFACSALLVMLPAAQSADSEHEPFTFVTRQGDQLYANGKIFRFISFNAPNLHINEDPYWHRTTPYEQEDCIKTIEQIGGRVVRIYSISVAGGDRQRLQGPSHVSAPGQYNETLFKDMDMMLALLNKHKIRVIIPFIDQWTYFGGKKQFAELYGKENFYDPVVVQGYKDLIKYVLMRTNTITGLQYRNDPAILAWETGNELSGEPKGWLHEVATYIKSLDTNHLVADGDCSVRDDNVDEPSVDMVTDHIYGVRTASAFVIRLRADRAKSKGKKAFYLGEFDPRPVPEITKAAFEEILEDGSTGALVWSLRFHKATGGYYDHLNYDNLYFQYPYDECTTITRDYAYKIQGLETPKAEIPEPPYLLPIPTVGSPIGWRGSVGANAYTVEKSVSPNGPWAVIGSDLSDKISKPTFVDPKATKASFYRVKAKNSSGESGYSNIRKLGDDSIEGGRVVVHE
jgi:hypothetical protein